MRIEETGNSQKMVLKTQLHCLFPYQQIRVESTKIRRLNSHDDIITATTTGTVEQ